MNTKARISNQASFIWEILVAYFSKNDVDKVTEIVSGMYEYDFSFSENLELLLGKLWGEVNNTAIYDIAEYALRMELYGTEQHYYIVAMLLSNRVIDVNRAKFLLELNTVEQYAKLDDKVRHVVDVLWLVREDEKDSVMSASDDDFLINALADLLPPESSS